MPTRSRLAQSLLDVFPDDEDKPVIALSMRIDQNDVEQPVHAHRKGQLVLALHGGVTCEVPQALWMVPPRHAVWIPGGMPHSNRATQNARLCILLVEPKAARLPDQCCTLAITPLVRELILHLAGLDPAYPPEGATARVVAVLLEQLEAAPIEQLHLPLSAHPKLRRLADALVAHPDDRTTLAGWAAHLAMSERTLARLVKKETGLTFGRWRQQLHLIIALQQLAAGVPVQIVAGQLGYDSVTAFITMFKKALGQPPAQYFAGLR